MTSPAIESPPACAGPYITSNGQYRLGSLFIQMNQSATFRPPYTLKDADHDGHVSLRRIYLEECDVGEHRFAQRAFGSWTQWLKLQETDWFPQLLKEWRQEISAKLQTEAADVIIKRMRTDTTSTGFQAAKWLADGKSIVGARRGPGRPRKPKQVLGNSAEADKDLKRLNLNARS